MVRERAVAMTMEVQRGKALGRARGERLRAYKLGEQEWKVRSRSRSNGRHRAFHTVRLTAAGRLMCECDGYRWRSVCVHVAVVARRIAREIKRQEGKHGNPQQLPPVRGHA